MHCADEPRDPRQTDRNGRAQRAYRWRLLCVIAAALSLVAPVRAQAPTDPRVLAAQGTTALAERRFSDALAAFTAAAAKRPTDASLPYGAGLAATMMGRDTEAEEFFSRALALQPSMSEAARQLGEIQYRSGRLADAIATYQAALAGHATDRSLAQRLTDWQAEARLQSRFNQARGQHFRVLFEGPEDQALARRVVDALERQYGRIGGLLHAYPERSIEVVLYTLQQFRDVTRSPAWAGAIYDGQIRVPTRGADLQTEYLERVLAHEYVHAVVTRLGGHNVPAWLHEGLATALEPGNSVDDAQTLLRGARASMPLPALDNGFARLDAKAAEVAYATSSVAVHRMLDMRGPDAIVLLLKDLATGTSFPTAFRQRIGIPYSEFQDLIR